MPGLTLHVTILDRVTSSTVRTFHDGSFYKMELILGNYVVYPDFAKLTRERYRLKVVVVYDGFVCW